MNHYEAKQEARRERLEAAAEKAKRNADLLYKHSSNLVAGIPPGQPILVGHHSERRHRNALDKSWNALGKAVAEEKRAGELAARAAAVGSAGISSDDPDAVDKLREKLAGLEAKQAAMKAANRIIKPAVRKGAAAIEAALPKLIALGYSEGIARKLFEPDFCGRTGFPDYALANNNGNMRRVRERISDLEQLARVRKTLEAEGAEAPETLIGDVRIVENIEDNRLQVFFPGKPSADVRRQLKSHGFRWSPTAGAWQRHLSSGAKWAAETIVKGM